MFRKPLIMARRMADIIAVVNESIEKPSTSLEVRTSNPALMMKVNKPRVIKVMGKVSNLITGRIKVVTIPQTKAVINKA